MLINSIMFSKAFFSGLLKWALYGNGLDWHLFGRGSSHQRNYFFFPQHFFFHSVDQVVTSLLDIVNQQGDNCSQWTYICQALITGTSLIIQLDQLVRALLYPHDLLPHNATF